MYVTTGETSSFDQDSQNGWICVGQEVSLLLNMLSRFVRNSLVNFGGPLKCSLGDFEGSGKLFND